MPAPGTILHLSEPSGPGVRLDSGIFEGWNVPLEYDPLLAKLAAWGPTRETAIRRLDRALSEYVLTGVRNNIAFFREVLADAEFRERAAFDVVSGSILQEAEEAGRRSGSRGCGGAGVGPARVDKRKSPASRNQPLARFRTRGTSPMTRHVTVNGRSGTDRNRGLAAASTRVRPMARMASRSSASSRWKALPCCSTGAAIG